MLSACVRRDDGGFGPEFDHMLLKVELPDPWLADVGFGESFVDPLPLRAGAEEAEDGHLFGVTPENGGWELYRRDSDGVAGSAVPVLRCCRTSFRNTRAMCEYHQTSPESSFTRRRICTMAQPDGRITLAGMRLIETKNGSREETLLDSEAELRRLPAGAVWGGTEPRRLTGRD